MYKCVESVHSMT